MQNLRHIFLRGLITFLPIALTIYILYAGVIIVENLLGNMIREAFPGAYVPGLGFALTIVLIFMFGLMLNNFFINAIYEGLERRLLKFPLINTVYSPLRDVMHLFSKKGQNQMKSVVMVDMTGTGMHALGLVTREIFDDIESLKDHANDKIAVYVPWSYGIGGFTYLVSRSQVIPVDIPVDRALTLALTGWVKSTPQNQGGSRHV